MVDVGKLMADHNLPKPFAQAIYSFAGETKCVHPDADIDWDRLAAMIDTALGTYNHTNDPTEYRRVYKIAALRLTGRCD